MQSLRYGGFTLIELLVAIGIIGLLIGISLPVLARARCVARSMLCLNNERQIVEGFHVLADTRGGALPGIEEDDAWDALVQECLNTNEGVFVCPSDDDALEASAMGFPGLSYGWREWFEVEDEAASLSGRMLSSARRGDLILVFEAMSGWHNEDWLNAATIDGSARPYTIEDWQENMARSVE